MEVQIDPTNALSLPNEYPNGDAQSHSPSSNDSGFHGDLAHNETDSNEQHGPRKLRLKNRNRPRDTYVSVFEEETGDIIYGNTAERLTKQ